MHDPDAEAGGNPPFKKKNNPCNPMNILNFPRQNQQTSNRLPLNEHVQVIESVL